MYSLGMPVSELRTKMRSEFERHRYVNQLATVDKLLQHSNAEYQVRLGRVGSAMLELWHEVMLILRPWGVGWIVFGTYG
jgi:hypothetical protein